MELGILHNGPPSTKRGCRAGRLHRLWHGLPPAPWPCTRSQHHSVPSRNLHPLMVPPFLQPHPDLQSAVSTPPSHPSILPNFLPLTVCCPLSHRWAVNPVTPLHSRLHHRCSRVVNPATPLLSRLHHHCRRAVNPLPWHSRLHHRRRRVVNPAMPLDSRFHHQHCCCVLVTLL
ncbi:hypothetical protein ACOMHN_043208 [Nucella lapillus]